MEFQLSIKMDNAAFYEDSYADQPIPQQGLEVARILRELADKVEDMGDISDRSSNLYLRDYNGNVVGEAVTDND